MAYLNLSYLEEITDGDPEVMIEMIQLFLEQTPPQLENIRKSIEEGDHKVARTDAHRIKPTFQYVGLMDLKEVMEEIEDRLTEEPDENEEILNMLERVEAGFKEVIPQLENRKKILSERSV